MAYQFNGRLVPVIEGTMGTRLNTELKPKGSLNFRSNRKESDLIDEWYIGCLDISLV